MVERDASFFPGGAGAHDGVGILSEAGSTFPDDAGEDDVSVGRESSSHEMAARHGLTVERFALRCVLIAAYCIGGQRPKRHAVLHCTYLEVDSS